MNEGTILMSGESFPLGDGFFSGTVEEDGHAFAINGVTSEVILNAPILCLRNSVDNGEIDLGDAAL